MTTEFKSLVNNIIHLSVLITSTVLVLGEGGVFFHFGVWFGFFFCKSLAQIARMSVGHQP